MKNDFRSVLNEVGKNLTLRRATYEEEPVWGEGTASYSDTTVKGFIDHYDLGREMLGLGDLGIGMSRAFLETSASPNVNNFLIDGSKTYKINRTDFYKFSNETVFVVCDLSLE